MSIKRPKRTFGFPLFMLIGFAVGAVVAVIVTFMLASGGGQFRYTGLVKMTFALGGLGTYAGHVVGAMKNKDAGSEPFGPITPGVMMLGGLIVVLGGALVFGAVYLVKGSPQ